MKTHKLRRHFFVFTILFFTYFEIGASCTGDFSDKAHAAGVAYNRDLKACEYSYFQSRCKNEAQLSYYKTLDQAANIMYICIENIQ